jgi:ubiquinone/menaquinone biosynthesis C-methylase UbiE
MVSPRLQELFGPYLALDRPDAVRLNVGCGRNTEPGFVNLDRVGGHGADVVYDLETAAVTALPFATSSVDTILCSHVLEHVTAIIPAMRELHRILKPGGALIALTPYASSNDAVEDPTHVRFFTENSWIYFDRRTHESDGHAGSYPSAVDYIFETVSTNFVPMPEYRHLVTSGTPQDLEVLRQLIRSARNVVQELQVVLRAVKP